MFGVRLLEVFVNSLARWVAASHEPAPCISMLERLSRYRTGRTKTSSIPSRAVQDEIEADEVGARATPSCAPQPKQW